MGLYYLFISVLSACIFLRLEPKVLVVFFGTYRSGIEYNRRKPKPGTTQV